MGVKRVGGGETEAGYFKTSARALKTKEVVK
jgi:hypothetical protein